MRRRSRLGALSIALGASLALAACSAPATSPGASPGDDQSEITIGVITSLSGGYSVLGGFVKNTIALLAEEANAAGGIDGHKVNVEYVDDHTDPTQAVTALRSLLAKKPVAIVGPILSSSCGAILDAVDQAKVPMVTTCATDSQVEPIHKYTFMSTLPTPGMAGALTDYLKSINKDKIGVLYDSADFGQSGFNALKNLGTANIVESQSYQLSSTTFLPQLTSLTKSDANAIVVWGAGPPLVTIAKEYSQLGSNVPIVFPGSAATPLFLGPAGASANGAVMASSIANVIDQVPDTNPSKVIDQKLATDYKAKYNEEMSQFTADSCGAWSVIANGIKIGGTDPVKIRDAIESNPAVGCHGTYKYSATDHRGLTAADVWIVTDQNGTLTATDYSVNKAK
ncbi:ABC transporter substrate-binding protein [Microbacterium kribbense]|uniref:ABC transporter substrate-binding protein n=1 Tax=Microbacterium kribbense TaxID=433645 RepID=A0ABP7G1Y2_9MICO